MTNKPIIIYDDACPMCKAYTAGFVKAGWVERTGFSKTTDALKAQLDLDRGRHEIPLFDPNTGTVSYGLEALFGLLGAKMPFLKPLFAFPPLRWLLYGLYQLITYNRRVIAGSAPPKEGFDCAPDRHVPIRVIYIVLALLAATWIIFPLINAPFAAYFFTIHLLFFLVGMFKKADKLDFLGHWATVLLASSLVLVVLPYFGLAALVAAGFWWLRFWVLR